MLNNGSSAIRPFDYDNEVLNEWEEKVDDYNDFEKIPIPHQINEYNAEPIDQRKKSATPEMYLEENELNENVSKIQEKKKNQEIEEKRQIAERQAKKKLLLDQPKRAGGKI
jgi:hypothetical protein